jgi:CBS domain containing-hemolysin-like protein
MEIIPQLILVIVLVLLNGFFVASEFALVSIRKTRVDELVKAGKKPAVFVKRAIDNLDQYISAIQLGVTLSSLALGWVGESTIANWLGPKLSAFLPNEIATISSHTIGIGISFIFITYVLIVLGELVPKTISYQKAEKVALLTAFPLTLFYKVFKPFVFILNKSALIVIKILRFSTENKDNVHTEEEIRMILAESANEGAIEKGEAEMVNSVLNLGDTPIKRVMIPKSKIVAFEKDSDLKKVIKISQQSPHSRFPVYDKTLDNIFGFVHIKDIYRNLFSYGNFVTIKELYLNFLIKNRDKRLSSIRVIRQIPKIKENTKADDVLLMMKRKRKHIAAVVNANNKTVGIVSLEDVVESLVGDINDEFDGPEQENEKKLKALRKLIKLGRN